MRLKSLPGAVTLSSEHLLAITSNAISCWRQPLALGLTALIRHEEGLETMEALFGMPRGLQTTRHGWSLFENGQVAMQQWI